MVNGAYELLVRTSRKFGGSIMKGGIHNFRSECGRGIRTSVMFIQERGRGDQGGRISTPGGNLPQGYPVPGRYGRLYRYTK